MLGALRERQVDVFRPRSGQHVTERPHFAGKPLVLVERQKDMRWPPPVGDDDRPPVGGALCAAKILIEFPA
ncbi:hypothetical protein D3C72_2446080 [compost metagenome]